MINLSTICDINNQTYNFSFILKINTLFLDFETMPKHEISFFVAVFFCVVFFEQQTNVDGIECYDCVAFSYFGEHESGPCFEVSNKTRLENDCTYCSMRLENKTDECQFLIIRGFNQIFYCNFCIIKIFCRFFI